MFNWMISSGNPTIIQDYFNFFLNILNCLFLHGNYQTSLKSNERTTHSLLQYDSGGFNKGTHATPVAKNVLNCMQFFEIFDKIVFQHTFEGRRRIL